VNEYTAVRCFSGQPFLIADKDYAAAAMAESPEIMAGTLLSAKVD